MKTHELKSLTPYFESVLSWRKTFEIRLDDRNFQVGDMIVLREWTGEAYTGRAISARITYITDFEQKPGYVVLGIDRPIAVSNVVRPREVIQEMLAERIRERAGKTASEIFHSTVNDAAATIQEGGKLPSEYDYAAEGFANAAVAIYAQALRDVLSLATGGGKYEPDFIDADQIRYIADEIGIDIDNEGDVW